MYDGHIHAELSIYVQLKNPPNRSRLCKGIAVSQHRVLLLPNGSDTQRFLSVVAHFDRKKRSVEAVGAVDIFSYYITIIPYWERFFNLLTV